MIGIDESIGCPETERIPVQSGKTNPAPLHFFAGETNLFFLPVWEGLITLVLFRIKKVFFVLKIQLNLFQGLRSLSIFAFSARVPRGLAWRRKRGGPKIKQIFTQILF